MRRYTGFCKDAIIGVPDMGAFHGVSPIMSSFNDPRHLNMLGGMAQEYHRHQGMLSVLQ